MVDQLQAYRERDVIRAHQTGPPSRPTQCSFGLNHVTQTNIERGGGG